ncbi:MAG: KilA-N domain-containing protein [Bacteroidales bacterium]|nr:KilA-N domain-containing protein [Bacteroidales bacterium]MBQ7019268.1 KilA-N domain-containing protein [Bacteroidales bacterium]
MGKNLKIFNYNDNSISFQVGETTMINATQMAKPFGKQPYEYLRLPSTQELIVAIKRRNSNTGFSRICDNQEVIDIDIIPNAENRIIRTIRGSSENGGGTWMHEDLALDFAQWLSVDFKLWCNDRIKELLLMGKVENNTFKSQRYIAGRNIMPGHHTPELISIGGHPVMTVHYNGNIYYKVKDIMKACEVWGSHLRKKLSEPHFKRYIYWFSDSTASDNATPKRYFSIDGVMKLFSSIRQPTKKASLFISAFAGHQNPTKVLTESITPKIDADKLLEVIVNTTKEEDRIFLYDIYKSIKTA